MPKRFNPFDPLGLFVKSDDPGNPERRYLLFRPPDPLGIMPPPDPYDKELRQLRQDLRDDAISEANYKVAVNEVLARKQAARGKGAMK